MRAQVRFNHEESEWDGFRGVLHLQQTSCAIDEACFSNPSGEHCVYPIDLRGFVDSLMFNCTAQPGMSGVIMECISFQGKSFRTEFASRLGLVGKKASNEYL